VIARRPLVLIAALVLGASTLTAQAAPPPPTPTTPPATAAPAAPLPPAAPAYLATREEAMTIGRETARLALTGGIDGLVALGDPAVGDSATRYTRLSDALSQIALQLGAERRMISEQVMKVNGRIEYWRTAEYEMVPVPLIFRVIMGAQGKWRGFTASTEDQAPAGEIVP
jgi:hypothetical protein